MVVLLCLFASKNKSVLVLWRQKQGNVVEVRNRNETEKECEWKETKIHALRENSNNQKNAKGRNCEFFFRGGHFSFNIQEQKCNNRNCDVWTKIGIRKNWNFNLFTQLFTGHISGNSSRTTQLFSVYFFTRYSYSSSLRRLPIGWMHVKYLYAQCAQCTQQYHTVVNINSSRN